MRSVPDQYRYSSPVRQTSVSGTSSSYQRYGGGSDSAAAYGTGSSGNTLTATSPSAYREFRSPIREYRSPVREYRSPVRDYTGGGGGSHPPRSYSYASGLANAGGLGGGYSSGGGGGGSLMTRSSYTPSYSSRSNDYNRWGTC